MTSYPTDPEKWLNLPYSYKAVHARQVRWYPGDSYHTLPSSLVDKGDVSLAHAEGDTLDGFMAALPQWDLPVVAGDPSSLPWRLIWTWHPVLEAFGHNKSANSSYSPDPWFYPAELFDNQKDVYKLLPAEIENYQDHVIVYPLYRLIVFHHTSKPRNKMINLLTSKLALPGDSTYFLSLKNRQPGDPLPTIPDWVNETCARKLHNALLVLLKQRSPNDTASWKSYAKTNNILVPDRPITLEELHQTSTPPTAAEFPTLADTVVPKPPAKALVAAKKGSLTTQTTTALRPSVPARPAQTVPSASSSTSPSLPAQSPVAPAVSPSLPSTMLDNSQVPPAPFLSAPATLPPTPHGAGASADVDMPPSSFPIPTSSLSGADKEKALRPLLHNATTISVQPASLPVPVSRPLVHELYAQAFALLPTIHTFYGLLTQKAKNLYDYLFNPAVTIVPAHDVDTVCDTPDVPMTDTTTGESSPTPMEISPTPFSQLVEDFVNLDASFADPGRLSAPEVQSADYSTEPHDTPAFDGSMLNHYIHSFTSYMTNFRNISPLSKILRWLKTFFSPLSSALPTTSTLAIVSTPTSLAVTSPLLWTVTRFYMYPSVQRVSGTDPLTGRLSWSIFLSLLSFRIFPALSVLLATNFAPSRRSLLSTLSLLHSLLRPVALVFISPPRNLLLEETFFSTCLTLPLLRILINLPLHSALFLLMRLSRLFAPLVKHTNRAAIHGVLTSLTPVLLPLINIFLSTALPTTDSPLLLSTTCTQ